MQTQPESMQTQPEPISPTGALSAGTEKKLIAPLWHTILVIAWILVTSYGGSAKVPADSVLNSRYFVYGATAVMEFVLFLLVWFGISRKGVKMRQMIGGRWDSPERFLIDVGIAIVFWVVSLAILFGVKVAVGAVDLHNLNGSLQQTKEAVAPLIPRSGLELGMFLGLTVIAGLFEEIVFRGYLMKQIGALAGNIYVGVVVSGILFGCAHGYQGPRQMVVLGAFGILFGLLAVWCKSLRPGMIAHAFTDAVSGIALFLS